MTVALVAGLVSALVFAFAWPAFTQRRVRRTDRFGAGARMFDEVVVHTKDDQSIRGLLVGEYTDYLLLEDARYLGGNAGEIDAGRVRVPRHNEAWTQLRPPRGDS